MRHLIAIVFTCAAATFAALPVSAQTATTAQTMLPAPSPTATPFQGFTATGTLALNATFATVPFSILSHVAILNNARKTRLDVLDVQMTGSDPNSVAMKAMLPQGAISFVIDQATNTMTVWSAQKHLYYQSKMQTPKPMATATPTASSQIDVILHHTSALSDLDVFDQSLTLVGHQPVNGHPAALFHFVLQTQRLGGKMQEVDADAAFADDLGGIPVRLWGTVKGAQSGDLKLDLTTISTTPAAPSAFVIPKGYTRATSLLQILGSGRPAGIL